MTAVGIEAMNLHAGAACLDVFTLAQRRNLDVTRFHNLLMKEKSVPLPYEDPITYGVNAAKPIIDALGPEQRDRIEMIVTCTESAFDFGKSMSTYFHQLLGLNRNCRLFELKNACYSGVAGLQTAVNFVLAKVSPGAKALVIATDMSRFMIEEGGDASSADWSFAEPSSGAGAVAMLISDEPHVFQIDVGANGYYGYEVMDTCRPTADTETGNSDLLLLSYLDCCDNAYQEYRNRVPVVLAQVVRWHNAGTVSARWKRAHVVRAYGSNTSIAPPAPLRRPKINAGRASSRVGLRPRTRRSLRYT
jgi:polyketide biosynthesis 3-hydroxy-3-methylglutaryl-CoA synthase-like enzyme PksG